MDPNPAILERIFTVADTIYDAAGKHTFPTVDAVRKQAKVNMNDACAGMRLWRHRQSGAIDLEQIDVPISLQQNSAAALQALWQQATALANEALRAAQAAWLIERREADTLSEQMASAFDQQAQELQQQQALLAAARQELAALDARTSAAEHAVEQLTREKIFLSATAEQQQTRVAEMAQRCSELQRNLELVHAALATAGEQQQAAQRQADARCDQLQRELALTRAAMTAADAQAARIQQNQLLELNEARTMLEQLRQDTAAETARQLAALAAAREEAATLRGALQALDKRHGKRAGRNTATGTDGQAHA